MVGNDMKRFAEKNGLTVNHRAVYGLYGGFAITLRDSWSSSRRLSVSMRLRDEEALKALNEWLNDSRIKNRFWISSGRAASNNCQVDFQDTLGTMRKISAFLEVFPEKLRESGAQGAEICPECGKKIEPGAGMLTLMGQEAVMMHEPCVHRALKQRLAAPEKRGSRLLKRLMGVLRKAG